MCSTGVYTLMNGDVPTPSLSHASTSYRHTNFTLRGNLKRMQSLACILGKCTIQRSCSAHECSRKYLEPSLCIKMMPNADFGRDKAASVAGVTPNCAPPTGSHLLHDAGSWHLAGQDFYRKRSRTCLGCPCWNDSHCRGQQTKPIAQYFTKSDARRCKTTSTEHILRLCGLLCHPNAPPLFTASSTVNRL
jgi:hypothetical protein